MAVVPFDFGWARRLVLAAGFMNTFRLGDFDMLTGRCDVHGYARLVRWLDMTKAPHRARGDAERLMQALAQGLGLQPDLESADRRGRRRAGFNRLVRTPVQNSTSLTIAVQREPADAARLRAADCDDPRISGIIARVTDLATMRMNLTSP